MRWIASSDSSNPWTSSGSYGSRPCSIAASEVGVPATAIPLAALTIAVPVELGVDQPPHVVGECVEVLGRRRVGRQVALRVAHRARLKRGVEVDIRARSDDQLGRAAADVHDQRAVDGRARRAGAEVREPGLLGAVEDVRRQREALSKLREEDARVLRVTDGAGRDRGHRVGLQRPVGRHVFGDRLADVLDRFGGELSGGVDTPPEPGHVRAALQLGDLCRRRPRRPGAAWSSSRCRLPLPASRA